MDTYILQRVAYHPTSTFGVLLTPDLKPLCLTLEDPWKDNKVGESCIPAEKYKCTPHNGTKYKEVWVLNNVPGRSAILIHAGNTHKDTRGCILVGESFYNYTSSVLGVGSSRKTLEMLRGALPEQFNLDVKHPQLPWS